MPLLFPSSLLALALAANPVFRCTDEIGAVSFQDMPCAADEESMQIRLPEEPAHAPLPAPVQPGPIDAPPEPIPEYRLPGREPTSWRCVADTGEVFYRHDGCPQTLPVLMSDVYGYPSSGVVLVDAYEISRGEACAAINAPSRPHSEHDQRAGPYEKMTGKDVCR